ncbi:MAG: aminotransferase class I/II-fold pyridoxal phosphate-dependent enzyme [Bacteroidota bacterium]
MPRVMNSEYMEWAKIHSHTRFNLCNSGILHYPMADLPVAIGELELNGGGPYGYEPLLNAIAAKYEVRTENVMTTLGTSMANYFVMAGILERGDEVLVEHPTYEPLLSTARYFDVAVKRFHRRFENGFRLDVDEIKRAVSPKTKLIVVTNLHNPGGVYADNGTLVEVGKIARSVGAHVLVDEVYLDAMFEKTPRSSIHLGEEFIVTNSLTKVYGLSGLRCGWVLSEPGFIRKLWRLSDLFYANAPFPAEQLSAIAFAHLGRISARSQKLLGTNHAVLNAFLDSRKDLQVVRPDFGTVVFPRLVKDEVGKLCSLLREKFETSVVPGRFFEMPRHFRIGMGCDTETLKLGLERLGAALDAYPFEG